jgi:hypothetical protein
VGKSRNDKRSPIRAGRVQARHYQCVHAEAFEEQVEEYPQSRETTIQALSKKQRQAKEIF